MQVQQYRPVTAAGVPLAVVGLGLAAEAWCGRARRLFGTASSGIGQDGHTVTGTGFDGPGGGELAIEATVDIGDVEVRR